MITKWILSGVLIGSTLQAAEVITKQLQLPVLKRNQHNQILHLNIKGSGTVSEIAITNKGTTDYNEIHNLEIFYSGGEEKFKAQNRFGGSQKAGDEVIFKGSQTLSSGDNWFWLTCEANDQAKLLNRIDAGCLYAIIDGKKVKPQVVSPPATLRFGIALCKPGDAGSKGYRIPGMATTNKGTLLAIYDMRFDGMRDLQGHMDIGLSRSTDGGETWEPQKSIIDMGEWGGLPEEMNGVSDGSVTVDRLTNTIYVTGLWMHGLRDKEGNFREGVTKGWQHQWHGTGSTPGLDPKKTCQFMMVKSTDDGKTWSKPYNITEMVKKPEWYLFAPAPGNGITMKNGTLVIPTQGRDAKGHPFSNFIYSTDRGKTWITSEPAKSNTTECAIVELSDGSLMLNMRDNRNYWGSNEFPESGRSVCVTKDMGKTWTEHPTSRKALPEPVCMASLVTHRFGKKGPNGLPGEVLFFSNPPNKTKKGGRHNMTIKMSADDGNTWPENFHLLLDEWGGAYSALSSINPRTLGIVYEGSRTRMVFQKIDIMEILYPGKYMNPPQRQK